MTTKEKILKLLSENDNCYISGSYLGEILGISRNAVWKSIKQLENEGYKISAVNNKGYRLISGNDAVTAESICHFLNSDYKKENITVLESVDSTNNYAKLLAEKGAPDRTVVIANRQTAGRGRMGRTFTSPKNTGIYMSIILKPDMEIDAAQLLTSYIAVAVSRAIDKIYNCSSMIKWVNDIMLNNKKICGILTEGSINCESASFSYIIAGIGINCSSVVSYFDEELLSIASSLEDETNLNISRNKLIAAIIDEFENNINTLYDRSFINEYKKRSWITGREIIINRNGKEQTAIAEDIDSNAALIVKYPDGTTDSLNTGEVRIKRLM